MSLRVDVVPCFQDNYAYVLSVKPGRAVVVDPSEAEPLLAHVRAAGLVVEALWVTHHHPDHTSGIFGLREAFPGVDVVAYETDAERVPHVTRTLRDGEGTEAAGVRASGLHVPGHTMGALGYLVEDDGRKAAVFTGDTLFGAGCGRLFEGTPDDMLRSLDRLATLADDVRVYPGHEYTESNLRFALDVSDDAPTRARLEQVRALRAQGKPSVPSTVAEERATNPFLRVREAPFAAGATAVEAFAALRRRKDTFRG